jgi:hypothetical protein
VFLGCTHVPRSSDSMADARMRTTTSSLVAVLECAASRRAAACPL